MWVTIAQFLLSLSILIVLHEFGHFGAAKWFKTRVEKFYLFFNPGFSLFKFQKGETEYGLGWLPLGGYVKISGMIDESFDKEQMKEEPKPWEFRSKPAWQRLIIMVGGVTVNFILGIILFAMILFVWGELYISNEAVTEGIAVSVTGYEMGLRDGDKILSVGDKEFDQFRPGVLTKEIIINQADKIYVERNGRVVEVPVDEKYISELTKFENRNLQLVFLKYPAVVDYIDEGSPAKASENGIIPGDRIIAINDKPTNYAHEFEEAVLDAEGSVMQFSLVRNADTLNTSFNTLFDKKQGIVDRLSGKEIEKRRRIGFWIQDSSKFYDYQKESYSLGRAIPAGFSLSWTFLTDQLKAFGQMFKGNIQVKESLGSFITIGKMFGTEWDWRRFWYMTASLSILLGFLNLLPIPALDGGYVMFLIFESITGKEVPDRVMEIANFVGFIVLILLMIYALGLDISRLF
ncbi:MAG: RIP metalloprotease RseP [Saprospiraceae bacterium]